jgi:hypothetical protein
LTERAEKAAKPLTNTGWLGYRRANESVEPNHMSVDETRDPSHGFVVGDLHEGVPFSEHLEQGHLSRTEPLLAALRAGGAADKVDRARVLWRASGHGDRLAAGYLC